MATAIRIRQAIPARPDDKISLTMTLREAQTLRQLFLNIGGSQNNSPRKHTDTLDRALQEIGITAASHLLLGNSGFFYEDVERNTL